jgi:hypothetical protein
MRFKNDEQ